MDSFWGTLMKQATDLVMHGKVVRILILGIIGTLIYAYTWANDQFVRQDDFTTLVAAVDKHIQKMDIMAAKALSGRREIQVQIAEATGAPEKEIHKLKRERDAAKRYEDCLIYEQGNCEFLMPKD